METTVHFQHFMPRPAMDTILVAEDHDDMRNNICTSLLPYFNVVGVPNGNQAWQMVVKYLPNLVIVDIMMPGMDGLSLCRHLKNDERTNHIPVIMLTGLADIETKIEGLQNGADDYMAKPFYAEELHARASNLIEARKKLREKYFRQFNLMPREVTIQSSDEKFISMVMNVVELHMDDSQFGVEIFAREVGLSSVQLYRKLHTLTGYSPNDFIREQRLQRSASLLEKKVGNVAEVAYRVGFNTLSYPDIEDFEPSILLPILLLIPFHFFS